MNFSVQQKISCHMCFFQKSKFTEHLERVNLKVTAEAILRWHTSFQSQRNLLENFNSWNPKIKKFSLLG